MRTDRILLVIAASIIMTSVCISYGQEAAQPAAKKQAENRLPDHLLRDPFWPIGTQPDGWGQNKNEKKELEGLKQWAEAAKKIEISGISKDSDGNYFAAIRGQGVVEKGDIITVDYAGLTYTWLVKDVTRKGIIPEKLNVAPTK